MLCQESNSCGFLHKLSIVGKAFLSGALQLISLNVVHCFSISSQFGNQFWIERTCLREAQAVTGDLKTAAGRALANDRATLLLLREVAFPIPYRNQPIIVCDYIWNMMKYEYLPKCAKTSSSESSSTAQHLGCMVSIFNTSIIWEARTRSSSWKFR